MHRTGVTKVVLAGVCLAGVICAGVARPVQAAEPAAGIRWQTDLKQGALASARTKRPMLLQFTADWCGYCKKMKRETYTDVAVIQQVNGCFIPITVDADEHEELVEALKIEALPATVFVSHDLRVLHKVSGFQQPREMQQHLLTGCQRAREAIRLTGAEQ